MEEERKAASPRRSPIALRPQGAPLSGGTEKKPIYCPHCRHKILYVRCVSVGVVWVKCSKCRAEIQVDLANVME